jgi:hypothetical protein
MILVEELCAALAQDGALRASILDVSTEDDVGVVLRISVPVDGQATLDGAIAAVGLMRRLELLRDVGQVRELARRYDIDPAALEALLPKEV